MKNRINLSMIIFLAWTVAMGALIGIARYNGEGNSIEFAIALLLWYDVSVRAFERTNER